MTSAALPVSMVTGYLAGALAACLFPRGRLARWLTATGAVIGGASALVLAGAELTRSSLGGGKEAFHIVDPLSAVFLAVVGAIVYARGNVLRLAPPLCITREEVDTLVDIAASSIRDLERETAH